MRSTRVIRTFVLLAAVLAALALPRHAGAQPGDDVGGTTPPLPQPACPEAWNHESVPWAGTTTIGSSPASISYNGALHVFHTEPWDSADVHRHALRHSWQDAAGWHHETVDIGTNSMREPSVASYNGKLYVFYYEQISESPQEAEGRLRVASWNGLGWTKQTLTVSPYDSVGHRSTAVVYGGKLHVFYDVHVNGYKDQTDLGHSVLDGATWTHQIRVNLPGGWGGPKDTVIFQNKLHVFFTQGGGFTPGTARRATFDGTTWSASEWPSGLGGISSESMTAAVHGDRIWTFFESSSGYLRTTSWTGSGTPTTSTIDGHSTLNGRVLGPVGRYASVVSYAGALNVLYQDSVRNDVRRARWNGSTWTTETIDGHTTAAECTSSAVGRISIDTTVHSGSLHAFYPKRNSADLAIELRHLRMAVTVTLPPGGGIG